jgi:hypothetical protein
MESGRLGPTRANLGPFQDPKVVESVCSSRWSWQVGPSTDLWNRIPARVSKRAEIRRECRDALAHGYIFRFRTDGRYVKSETPSSYTPPGIVDTRNFRADFPSEYPWQPRIVESSQTLAIVATIYVFGPAQPPSKPRPPVHTRHHPSLQVQVPPKTNTPSS